MYNSRKQKILNKFRSDFSELCIKEAINYKKEEEFEKRLSLYEKYIDNSASPCDFYADIYDELALFLFENEKYDISIEIINNIIDNYNYEMNSGSKEDDDENSYSYDHYIDHEFAKIETIETLKKVKKDSFDYLYYLAQLYCLFYEFRIAKTIIDNALETYGENKRILELILDNNELFDFEFNYENILKRLLKLEPDNMDYYDSFIQIQRYRFKDSVHKVFEDVLFALKINSTDHDAWRLVNDRILLDDKKLSKKEIAVLLGIINTIDIENLEDFETVYQIAQVYRRLGKEYIAIEILESLINKDKTNADYYGELARAYDINNNIDLAIQYMEIAVSYDKKDRSNLYYLVYLYRRKGRFNDAINILETLVNRTKYDLFYREYFIELLIAYAATEQKQKLFKEFKKFARNKKVSLSIVLRLKSKLTLNEAEWIELFDSLIPHDITKESYMGDEIFINHIIRMTKGMKEKGKIRYNLITLYQWVNSIKKTLLMKYDEKNVIELCHYSSLQSLNYLIKKTENDEEPYMRLNSVAYVNDPSEGLTFLNLIKNVSIAAEDTITEIFNNDLNKKEIEIPIKNTYLASFSLAKNKLPLWVQYANNGEGCCYVMDSTNFDKKQNNFNLKQYIDKDDLIPNIELNNYCLYRVFYINSEGGWDKDKLSTNIRKATEHVAHTLVKLSAYLNNNYEIRKVALDCLDQVRFLFKESDYEHEKEVRVLQFANNEDILLAPTTEGYRVPHAFINMKKKMQYKEIILGPRVEKTSEIAQFVNMGKNVRKVTFSNIKYR